MAKSPYGTWRSPVTAALLVEQAVRLSQLQADRDVVYWNEGRPAEAGRQVIVSLAPGGSPTDAIPEGYSARSQVHEYGGRCYAVKDGTIVFSNWQDQRLYLVEPGGATRALTPEPAASRAARFADPVFSNDGQWVICVRERHAEDGRVDNDLVAISAMTQGSEPVQLASGHDFYGAPRLSPDGEHLAWVTWDQPDMPWDRSQLWVAAFDADATLADTRLVAGDPGESITEPRWSQDGVLHYVSDRTGWWNIYNDAGDALCPLDAEFGGPDWVFGNSSYVFVESGRIAVTWHDGSGSQIGWIDDGRAQAVDLPLSQFGSLQPAGENVVAIAASPTSPAAVVRLDLDKGSVEWLRRSRQVPIPSAAISEPEPIEFKTGENAKAHALFYPPRNPDFEGPDGELPPVIVEIHGGPTSATSSAFDLEVQYWTSRGFAVVDVDYRGSTGYGTAYRRLLDGAWGVVDVEDCASVVAWLAAEGRVDGKRALIRGGSAGGFTTLAALAFTDAFAAGASHFGVADLAVLARDTHKFEARYLDRLIGPWPQDEEVYTARSPIHHTDQITSPLILFQGLEDAVVPAAQSEMMFEALSSRGVPVAYLPFEGEQHGFRQAATIIAVAEAELAFYGEVLGFVADGAVLVDIRNAGALRSAGRSS